MTRSNRQNKLLSPTAGLSVLWAIIRFFLVSYSFMFGKPGKSAARSR
jgi:hypothetical protein